MHAQQRCRKFVVEFDEYMLGELCICGHIALREHEAGRTFKVNMFTGASTSDHVDGVMSRANAYNMRALLRTPREPHLKMYSQSSRRNVPA